MSDQSERTVTTLTLPVLPLTAGVVFPQMVVTLALETDEAKAAADAAATVSGDPTLLLVPRLPSGRYANVGMLAHVENQGTLPGGTPALVVRAIGRAHVGAGVIGATDALWVEAEPVVESELSAEGTELANELREAVRTLFERLGGRRLTEVLREVEGPSALADLAGWWPDLAFERKVELLETVDVEARLRLVLAWVTEALSGLPTDDDGDAVSEYRGKLAALVERSTLTDETRDAITREIDRLERTPPQNMEHGWIRTWLDTAFTIPWGDYSEERIDVAEARAVLDEDHTGLDDVKERIVEFLAVRKLRADRGLDGTVDTNGDDGGTTRRRPGTIVALVGPPGVGKTSLGASVARALGRKFVRVALGGVRDEAEIRGHRRTYVGAQAGRIVRAMQEAKSMNPVFLLDEVDKVGSDWRGDPSSALLEVLDPAQNHKFRDHYLEVDLDLSDVLFIATANVIETIPAPLLDRMEIVRLDGYTEDEKVAIARDHLLAGQATANGVRPGEVEVSDDALHAIVAGYTREAGVRNLDRELARVLRKAAVRIANGDPTPITVDEAAVRDFLGRQRFHAEVADRTAIPGVATGLAVTGAGGDVLFVEATSMTGDRGLTVTGQLGDVMKESAEIALSYVRSHAEQLGIDDEAFDRQRFHVHFPAGAVPKDGPSAGVTMTTALVSLLTNRAVRPEVGMTGEVTLSGRVLPIGGVKQKVLAAHRAGLTEVILPEHNEADLDDVPERVRDDMAFHLVDDVARVIELALTPSPATPTRSLSA